MSLIEQAAKRLEELKRTGVHVPDDEPQPQETRQTEHHYTPTPELMAGRLNEPHSQPMYAAEAPRQYNSPSNANGKQSQRIEVDLARLAAAGLVTPEAPHSPLANEFRVIKRPLLANAQGKSAAPVRNGNLIMVTSALPGEGKSFSALNLAMSMAMEMDSTVLLIDADVANPSLLKVLGMQPAKGLMDVLTDESLQLSDVILRTNIDKLSILPAGTPHQRATELLASDAMVDMVAEMANRYGDRVLIFDSPPLLPTTESRVLANHMGQIVLVVEADSTTHGNLKSALAQIESCQNVMMVLNKASQSEVGQYYGYYGYARASQA